MLLLLLLLLLRRELGLNDDTSVKSVYRLFSVFFRHCHLRMTRRLNRNHNGGMGMHFPWKAMRASARRDGERATSPALKASGRGWVGRALADILARRIDQVDAWRLR